MSDRDVTIVRLVEAVTMLLGEHPQWDLIRSALFDAAQDSGHLRDEYWRPNE